ncbi:ABC transporter permease [Herbiconiux daphne]|uniref:ABC transporter permease n=1 Tax=Herbiconiux daphne TaxID=2970914 RepID=A0ABT2H365_9MICO|nr:hypothetical protein [Herbiconiux daphne]MCS5734362.1 hypothetical protein [Herbiconiux daphne]
MIDVIAAVWQSATPLVLAALAGALAQRAGIWHLGLGGLMSIGAMLSVVLAKETGNIPIALIGACFAATVVSALMWFVIVKLSANPIIVGIGVNALGLGGTILGIVAIYGAEGTVKSDVGIPRVFDAVPGPVGQLSLIAVATPFLAVLVWWFVCRTRIGLQITATGDFPFAARSAGISTSRMRLYALLLGGVLCGLSGAELSLGTLQSFSPGMEAGRGLIAFAAVILGAAHPLGSVAAAVFFGAVNYFGIWAQLNWRGVVPTEFMLMLPYIVTIIAVVITARVRGASKSFNLVEMRDG